MRGACIIRRRRRATTAVFAITADFDHTRPLVIVQPRIIPRPEHNISRSDIADSALKVLYQLKDAGFRACLVGGGVRDLLLGAQPKDFDVATDASPEEVRQVFKNSRLIGRRFRLAHVRFGRDIIEVSTFRADLTDAEHENRTLDDTGRILRDNVYGCIEEDARRRDFTVNGLYYDINDFAIYDYVGGMADIETRTLRLMGDPDTRYREDPVRMLRALRIATKLDLTIEPNTLDPISRLAGLMADVPAARLFDEVLKALMAPYGARVYQIMRENGLFEPLFPQSVAAMRGAANTTAGEYIIRRALENTGQRILDDKPVTPAFLYAAFLWPGVREAQLAYIDDDKPPAPALAMAQRDVISAQVQRVSIPKRFSVPMREIWQLQPRFYKRRGKQPQRLMTHPRFRAAYDFLLLRAEAGEVDQELADWWTQIQESPDSMAPPPAKAGSARRRRGGRGRRKQTT